MIDAAIAAAISLVVLIVMFVPLERAFPARPEQGIFRPRLGIDLIFFLGQYLVFQGLAVAMLIVVQGAVSQHEPASVVRFLASIPLPVKAVFAVVLGDLSVYWFHRACHHYDFLWRFHAVHHSSEHLDWLAAHREHPFDGMATQLLQNFAAFALGFPLEVIAGFIAFRGMWAVYVHSNARLPLGPLKWLVGAPELHHWHHARVERTTHNFANLAPYLDLIFRTHHLPEGPERYPLGLDGFWPKGYFSQLAYPFLLSARAFWRVARTVGMWVRSKVSVLVPAGGAEGVPSRGLRKPVSREPALTRSLDSSLS